MANTPIHIRVPVSDEIRHQLKVIAAQKKMTIAELFRTSVEMRLKSEGVTIDLTEGLDTWGGPGRKGKDDG